MKATDQLTSAETGAYEAEAAEDAARICDLKTKAEKADSWAARYAEAAIEASDADWAESYTLAARDAEGIAQMYREDAARIEEAVA